MKKLKAIAIISIALNISILSGCDTSKDTISNVSMKTEKSVIVEKKELTQKEVYQEIKDFMFYDFHIINNNLSNIDFVDNDYQKISNEELDKRQKIVNDNISKIDDIINTTKNYKNINKFFVEMKEYVINRNEEVKNADYYIHSGYGAKTTNYDKEGYIFYNVKIALINDGFDNELIEDWNKIKVD